jgi:septal ring factor EnvC (AmiA/AmiB activator)
MQIALITLLISTFSTLLHASETLSDTQLKISKTYQAITELDISIQEQTTTIKQLKIDIQKLTEDMKDTKKKLDTSNKNLSALKSKSKIALSKLYHLSFSDKSADQIYLTYYSRKVIAQQAALKTLKQEQEKMIDQQANEQTKYQHYITKHTELNQQLLRQKSKLESKVTSLQSLLDDTLKKAHQEQNMNHTILSPIIKTKGQLPWPSSGKITQHFGSPLYNSQLKAEAILIEPTEHDVKAVHPGKIIYTDWLPAYGYLIIIDHGDNYHTLYGHLDHTTVSLNQTVTAGEIIGEINQSSTQHKQLFFSIKHHLTAQDPEKWLLSST